MTLLCFLEEVSALVRVQRLCLYLWRVFHHLPHQGCDVLPHILIWIFEAGHGSGEDVGFDHHLCQADRVLADLAEGRENLPLCGDKARESTSGELN